jgi:hypothetical protein
MSPELQICVSIILRWSSFAIIATIEPSNYIPNEYDVLVYHEADDVPKTQRSCTYFSPPHCQFFGY